MPKLDRFDGGMSEVKAKHLLPATIMTSCNNINLRSGTATPILGPDITDGAELVNIPDTFIKTFFSPLKDEFIPETSIEVTHAEYDNLLFRTDGTSGHTVENTDTSNTSPIGGLAIDVTWDISRLVEAIPLTPTVDQISTGDLTPGEYVYRVLTYFDRNSGDEFCGISRDHTFTVEDTFDGLTLHLGILPLNAHGFISNIKLYRLFEGEFRLIDETSVPGAVTFVDDVLALVGDIYTGEEIGFIYAGDFQYVTQLEFSDPLMTSGVSNISPVVSTEFNMRPRIHSVITTDTSAYISTITSKVYRLSSSLPEFFFISSSVGASDIFVDEFTNEDLTLTGQPILDSSTITNRAIPDDSKYIGVANGVTYIISGTQLHFSSLGRPLEFPASNFLEFGLPLVGWGNCASGILVFGATTTWRLTGNTSDTFAIFELAGDIGCIHHDSIQRTGGYAIWMSRLGVTISDGRKPVVISSNFLFPEKFGRQSTVQNYNQWEPDKFRSSAVFDSVYYALYYDTAESQAIPGLAVYCDFDQGLSNARFQEFSIDGMRRNIGSDVNIAGFTRELFTDGPRLLVRTTNEGIAQASGSFIYDFHERGNVTKPFYCPYSFITKEFTEGIFSNLKDYHAFYQVTSNNYSLLGTGTLQYYIDNIATGVLQSNDPISSQTSILPSDNAVAARVLHELQPSVNDITTNQDRGRSIYFQVINILYDIYEVSYEVAANND